MLLRLLPAAVLAASAAGADPACLADGTCSPVAGCVEETGEVFRGHASGLGAGDVRIEGSSGAVCEGEWLETRDGNLAALRCDDGREIRTVFEWYEPETGTAAGDATVSDGTSIRFWSGRNLRAFFDQADPAELARLRCSPADLLVS